MWRRRVRRTLALNPFIESYQADIAKGIAIFHVEKHAQKTVDILRRKGEGEVADQLQQWKDSLR